MSDITALLQRWCEGDREAFETLLPVMYKELLRLTRQHLRDERKGLTLQPTTLVYKAYLRLCDQREMSLEHRAHFFGAAAQVMRRILVEYSRKHRSSMRGGGAQVVRDLAAATETVVDLRVDHETLDEALKKLEEIAPEKARVVELRYFGGLSMTETAQYLDLSPPTVKRYWSFSRAWLFRRLAEPSKPS